MKINDQARPRPLLRARLVATAVRGDRRGSGGVPPPRTPAPRSAGSKTPQGSRLRRDRSARIRPVRPGSIPESRHLGGHIAPGFEQIGHRRVLGLNALQGARHPHRGQAGAHRNLAGDERRPPRRAARLGVGVGRLSMDATSPSDHPGQGEIAAFGPRSSVVAVGTGRLPLAGVSCCARRPTRRRSSDAL